MTTTQEDLKDAALVCVSTLSRKDFAEMQMPDAEIFTKCRAGWLSGLEGAAWVQETLGRI